MMNNLSGQANQTTDERFVYLHSESQCDFRRREPSLASYHVLNPLDLANVVGMVYLRGWYGPL